VTLTVRSSSVTGATTAGRALTHAQMDANWAHVIDSANHTFTQSGTGATSRTMQAKARDLVSVKDFGATGDGTTNDRAAIQAAIDHADALGLDVYLPNGTYLIGSGLTINGTVGLIGSGWGSIIKVDSSASRFIPILVQGTSYAAVRGVVLRDFKVDGSSKGTLDSGLVQLNNAVGFLVDHLWVTSGGTAGESSSQGVDGISCSAGSLGEMGSQGVIQNCLVEACTKPGINWSTESLNALIIGNIVRSNTGNTSTPGIQILGGYNVKVIGNSVYSNQGYGIYMGTSGGVGTYRNARYALIANNHVYENGQGSTVGEGILVANAATTSSQFGRIIITGNVVHTNGVGVNSHGIHVQNDNNIIIAGNYCYNNKLAGIMVEACENVSVHGNTCESNNTADAANTSGIYLKAAASSSLAYVSVSNNKCINGSGKHQKFAVYYDNSAAQTVTDISITDNIAAGHETSDGFLSDDALPTRFFLRHRRAGQTTTGNTATNVFYATLRDNSAARVTAKTTAVKSDGSERAAYDKTALVYRDGGSATVQGSVAAAVEIESDATWDQTINVTGNFVRCQVTGVAATTITWNTLMEVDAE
jgi:parallel beta-helix repeat protein